MSGEVESSIPRRFDDLLCKLEARLVKAGDEVDGKCVGVRV